LTCKVQPKPQSEDVPCYNAARQVNSANLEQNIPEMFLSSSEHLKMSETYA